MWWQSWLAFCFGQMNSVVFPCMFQHQDWCSKFCSYRQSFSLCKMKFTILCFRTNINASTTCKNLFFTSFSTFFHSFCLLKTTESGVIISLHCPITNHIYPCISHVLFGPIMVPIFLFLLHPQTYIKLVSWICQVPHDPANATASIRLINNCTTNSLPMGMLEMHLKFQVTVWNTIIIFCVIVDPRVVLSCGLAVSSIEFQVHEHKLLLAAVDEGAGRDGESELSAICCYWGSYSWASWKGWGKNYVCKFDLLWSSLLHIYYNWVNFVLSEWVSFFDGVTFHG